MPKTDILITVEHYYYFKGQFEKILDRIRPHLFKRKVYIGKSSINQIKFSGITINNRYMNWLEFLDFTRRLYLITSWCEVFAGAHQALRIDLFGFYWSLLTLLCCPMNFPPVSLVCAMHLWLSINYKPSSHMISRKNYEQTEIHVIYPAVDCFGLNLDCLLKHLY